MFLHLISLLTIFMAEPKKHLQKRSDILSPIKNTSAQDCYDSRLRVGKCITLAKCPHLIKEFYDDAHKTSYGIDFQTFVSNSICGFDGTNFLICCGTQTFYPITINKPAIFHSYMMTTKKPFEPVMQTTVFKFSPLSSRLVQFSPTASKNNNVLPITYSQSDVNTISTTETIGTNELSTLESITNPTSDNDVIIFNPIVQPQIEGAQATQSNPVQTTTLGTLISQTVHQPFVMPTTPITTPAVVDASECGVSKGTINRVVGGDEAKRGNYPWMAALGYRDEYDPSTLKYLCAGSLISSKYVITSAHCINSYLMLVRLGAHDLENPSEPHAKNYPIKRTVIHEMFDLKTIANDLALIELSETVVITDFILPICLPADKKFLTQEFIGMNPFVAGWGATKHQGPTSNVLRNIQVPIINRRECEQSYRTTFNFLKFSEKLICAGNSNVDACQGDSGGPLMLPQINGTSYYYYLLGVVSFGYECARTGFPGVYARVAAYMPWIKSHMV